MIHKLIVASFACLLTLSSAAGETTASDTKQGDKERQIVQLSLAKVNATIADLNRKVGECKKTSEKNILAPELLRPLPLTDKEIITVVSYFLSRAEDKCYGKKLRAKATMEFLQLKYIEKYYRMENTTEPDLKLDTLCCVATPAFLEREQEYLKIDPKVRARLEKLPELQQPFNFFRTIDKLGLGSK